VSRTGYTGDLGYEVWVEREHASGLGCLRRGGKRVRCEACRDARARHHAQSRRGLILIEVDFDSVRRALISEQSFSPFELGISGRFVDFEKHS
jgi:aminomethyltransferase